MVTVEGASLTFALWSQQQRWQVVNEVTPLFAPLSAWRQHERTFFPPQSADVKRDIEQQHGIMLSMMAMKAAQ